MVAAPDRTNYNTDAEFAVAHLKWIQSEASPIYGWPAIVYRTYPIYTTQSVKNSVKMPPVSTQEPATWYWFGVTINTAVAIIILFVAWLILEKIKFFNHLNFR